MAITGVYPDSKLGELAGSIEKSSAVSNTPSTRLACVDLVRTIAIVTTISMHLLGSGASSPDQNWLYPFFFHGGYGVIIFFVVSGFVISYTTAARDGNLCQLDIKRFYRYRAARILPLLCLVIVLGAALKELAPLGTGAPFHACFWNTQPAAKYDGLFWLSLFTFWFNWLTTTRGAHLGFHWDVMWTLSIEEQFYILFPFVLRGSRNTTVFCRVLLLLIALVPLVRLAAFLSPPRKVAAALVNSVGSFDQIAMGCLLFLCWNRFSKSLMARPRLQWFLVIAGAMLAVSTYYFTSPFSLRDHIFAPTFLAAGVAMFLLGALGLKVFERLPRLVLLPGQLSYGGYLYQATALYICWNIIHEAPYWLALPIYLLVIFFVATVSYYFYEAPLNRSLRGRKAKSVKLEVAQKDTVRQPGLPTEIDQKAVAGH